MALIPIQFLSDALRLKQSHSIQCLTPAALVELVVCSGNSANKRWRSFSRYRSPLGSKILQHPVFGFLPSFDLSLELGVLKHTQNLSKYRAAPPAHCQKVTSRQQTFPTDLFRGPHLAD